MSNEEHRESSEEEFKQWKTEREKEILEKLKFNSGHEKIEMLKSELYELAEELRHLQTVREKEIAEKIKKARALGDLSENIEYDEAKDEQGKLYSRIAEIKRIIENSDLWFGEKVEIIEEEIEHTEKKLKALKDEREFLISQKENAKIVAV